MHSGVRILSYLQQILFRNEETSQTDDDLLALDNEDSRNVKERDFSDKTSNADDAVKLRDDVVRFLKKMLDFLLEKTKDKSIHCIVKGVNRPKLMAEPGLNATSSLAVAARAVIIMMNKYTPSIRKSSEVKDLLIKCAGVFLALYANKVPAGDTLRNRKTRELLLDATIDLLSALCFFDYGKRDYLMPQLILNTFVLWKGQEEIDRILPLFIANVAKLNTEAVNNNSVMRIQAIAEKYMSQDIPVNLFSLKYDTIYQLRTGFGFLVIDNLQRTSKGWSYVSHAPWFDDKIDNNSATTFKGFFDL